MKDKAEEIIIAVKAVGNAGHPGSLKSLMKLLPNFGAAADRLPQRVHIETALALRNIAKKEPRMVRLHNQEHTGDLFFQDADV